MKIRIHKEHLRQELLSPMVIIGSVITAVMYLGVSTLILNNRLVIETLTGSYPITHKLAVFRALLQGTTTLYSPFESGLLSLLGLLFGINLILIMKSLRQQGNWSFGLGTVGALAATGCASCGITALSFLGPSVSAGLLPFSGLPLQLLSLSLLLFSLFYNLSRKTRFCRISR